MLLQPWWQACQPVPCRKKRLLLFCGTTGWSWKVTEKKDEKEEGREEDEPRRSLLPGRFHYMSHFVLSSVLCWGAAPCLHHCQVWKKANRKARWGAGNEGIAKKCKLLAAAGSIGYAHKVSALPCCSSPPTGTTTGEHGPKGLGGIIKTDCHPHAQVMYVRYSNVMRRLQMGIFKSPLLLICI